MIYNERQYKITLKQLEMLKESIDAVTQSDMPEWLVCAQEDSLKSQISELKTELIEYDLIKEGKLSYTESADLSSLPKTLITARIAKGMSQKNLADMLGLKQQQVQRYEASNYMGASLSRLIGISQILGVKIKETWSNQISDSGEAMYIWQNSESVNWNQFPSKEMIKNGWLDIESNQTIEEATLNYFTKSAGLDFVSVFHRKKFHGKNKPNEYSLLAWQARVLELARKEYQQGLLAEFDHNDTWLNDLVSVSREKDGPNRAKDILARNGIALIVVNHLESTYLDGAAMCLDTGNPVVALTLRYDRLDNFWFVLFHELGHVFLHLFDSLNMDFFDEENNNESDQIESAADKFALDCLIPEDRWATCTSRFALSKEAVLIDAERVGVHPSIIAGRIRKERNNYSLLSDLVGNGEVRKQFGEKYGNKT